MHKETLLITERDIRDIFENNCAQAIDIVKEAFIKDYHGDTRLPDKISQIFDEKTQNRINCMPATLVSDNLCGVKWVSVFPKNPSKGLKNVTGTIILSEIESGYTMSVMDAAYITGLRTAAVGATAALYLAKTESKSIGFIGAGQEARKHFEMLKLVRPGLFICYVSSRTEETCKTFIEELQAKYPDVTFVNCGNNYESAVVNSDIVVTATSTQKDLLKASWIKKGAMYIHVGGWEDEFAVVKKADKIVCDKWESVKHRSQTLSLMYKNGDLHDDDIYADLGEIISGEKASRETDGEFIYFNSVGLAFIDVMFAKFVYEECEKNQAGMYFSFVE